MSKELIISLYVLGGLLALWLLIVIILLISIIVLKRNIRREKSAINIILAQKYDIAIVLAKFYIENQVILPQEVQEELNLNKAGNSSFSTFERKTISKRIEGIIEALIHIDDESIVNNSRCISLKNSISDVETQYRRKINAYNNHVAGYNYWINFIFFKPITKIFKIKKIDSIKY